MKPLGTIIDSRLEVDDGVDFFRQSSKSIHYRLNVLFSRGLFEAKKDSVPQNSGGFRDLIVLACCVVHEGLLTG